MIDLIQFIAAPTVSPVLTEPLTYNVSVTQGNLLVLVGKYDINPGSTISVSDSLGNTYTIDQPIESAAPLPASYWFAYAVAQSTGPCSVTIVYSGAFTNQNFGALEFFNSIGWVNPPASDGLSFLGGTGTALTSSPITTSNSDDLLIALYTKTATTASIVEPWKFITQISTNRALAWLEVIPSGLITPFNATQSTSGAWNVALWALQANITSPNTIDIITAVVNPTAFVEAYPNRIKEDIYDCLEGNPGFVYVPYGPTYTNV